MQRRGLLTALSATILAVGAMLGAAPTAADRDRTVWSDDGNGSRSAEIDAAAAAIPSADTPTVMDHTVETERTGRAGVKAVASAVATSDCDGCDGRATVLQVVHVNGRNDAAADNSAAAWSSCVGCASSAVSVQVVVARDPAVLTANNRALALNVACDGCTTTAAAIQFVVTGENRRDLTAQARELIAQLEAQLADRLSNTARPEARRLDGVTAERLVEDTAQELERIIGSEIGGTVQRSIDVQVAG